MCFIRLAPGEPNWLEEIPKKAASISKLEELNFDGDQCDQIRRFIGL